MGIKNWMAKAYGKAGDKVAKLAALSPEQLQEVQKRREEYLSEIPNPNDSAAEEMTARLLAANGVEIYNAFLPQLQELYVPVQREAEYGRKFNVSHNIRYFKITKWVTDKKENSLEKLVNVYQVLSNEECNIALIFHRSCTKTDVYLAVVDTQNSENNINIDNYKARLIDAVRGNFPGAEWEDDDRMDTVPCLKENVPYSVAVTSNVPGEKSEKFISQTIEKLLDGIIPDNHKKEYTIILLATPIQDVEERKLRLSELYSGLAPYAGWSTQFSYNESDASTSMATFGVNAGVSAGIQNAQNQAVTNSQAQTNSENQAVTDANANAETDQSSENKTLSSNRSEANAEGENSSHVEGISDSQANSKMEGVNDSSAETKGKSFNVNASTSLGVEAGIEAGPVKAGINATQTIGADVGVNSSHQDSHGTSSSETETISKARNISDSTGRSTMKTIAEGTAESLAQGTSKAITNTVSKAITNSVGKAVTRTVANTVGSTRGVNLGGNFGANFARSSNVTATVGRGESLTQNYSNYSIKHALEMLEEQMKRYEQSTALGMWDFAAYVLSEDMNVANNVAHSYLALTQGENSYMSHSFVTLWRGDAVADSAMSIKAKEICSYLRELRHPIFGLNIELTEEAPTFNVYPDTVTAATSLSGKELAYSLNFPQKSVSGLPVIECAEFGRNVISFEEEQGKQIRLGNIFHMNHKEPQEVRLSLNSLASHTFITGSTGSGKSNTVYRILEEARELNVNFLVVEPAKGEYKNVFGNDPDVFVYGTNPALTPLLRINPFSFPKDIHILEHLDRLVEIFNVCWPMYAAMPAVLKSAIEKSYEDCGWDLVTSTNKYDDELYPEFADVARNIKVIIESSEYDAENKGAYKGSLLTRLQSLTNGINGLIFSSDEISDAELFDRCVIVELSRVGSTETKSLIMGMLVMKLQEHRMSGKLPMNADLRHITVLEEAHNILRRTSTEQATESANILGKSVEMLANAIAEMRTYGEGFIIADQAPGLMDMSVIRNTNTKIIMRLPDQGDRELVGKAANLNDDQITELAKLPRGVAAIYQNEWVQPVLCKVDRHENAHGTYINNAENGQLLHQDLELSESLLRCIMDKELFQMGDKEDLRELRSQIVRSRLSSIVKVDFLDYIDSQKEEGLKVLRCLLYDFLHAEGAIDKSVQHGEIREWVESVIDQLNPSIQGYTKKQIDLAIALILYEQAERDSAYNDVFCRYTEIYRAGGGVF